MSPGWQGDSTPSPGSCSGFLEEVLPRIEVLRVFDFCLKEGCFKQQQKEMHSLQKQHIEVKQPLTLPGNTALGSIPAIGLVSSPGWMQTPLTGK